MLLSHTNLRLLPFSHCLSNSQLKFPTQCFNFSFFIKDTNIFYTSCFSLLLFFLSLFFIYLFCYFKFNLTMAPVLTPEVTSNVQWISQMSVDVEPTAGRKTTIIGTIGKLLGYSHHCIFINTSYLIIFLKVPIPIVLK
jgi:hypothetical protein